MSMSHCDRTTVESFAMRLRRLRQERGWSQRELARRVGSPQMTMRHWELLDHTPRADYLAALADVFGMTMDALWRGEDQDGR